VAPHAAPPGGSGPPARRASTKPASRQACSGRMRAREGPARLRRRRTRVGRPVPCRTQRPVRAEAFERLCWDVLPSASFVGAPLCAARITRVASLRAWIAAGVPGGSPRLPPAGADRNGMAGPDAGARSLFGARRLRVVPPRVAWPRHLAVDNSVDEWGKPGKTPIWTVVQGGRGSAGGRVPVLYSAAWHRDETYRCRWRSQPG